MMALRDRRRAGREDLPGTGVPLALEEALSSAFVDFPEHGYGTRCSTVLVASAVADGWDLAVQEVSHAHRPDDQASAQSVRLHWSFSAGSTRAPSRCAEYLVLRQCPALAEVRRQC